MSLNNAEILEGDELITKFMNPDNKIVYKKSGIKDINGVEILEGSIIDADGYNSDLKDHDALNAPTVERPASYTAVHNARELGKSV